jgi:hypothetical protein
MRQNFAVREGLDVLGVKDEYSQLLSEVLKVFTPFAMSFFYKVDFLLLFQYN